MSSYRHCQVSCEMESTECATPLQTFPSGWELWWPIRKALVVESNFQRLVDPQFDLFVFRFVNFGWLIRRSGVAMVGCVIISHPLPLSRSSSLVTQFAFEALFCPQQIIITYNNNNNTQYNKIRILLLKFFLVIIL